MPSYDLPNLSNASGLEDLFIYEASQVDFLIPGILFFIFIIIASTGYFAQKRQGERGNMPMWLSIASFITTTGGFMLFLYNGIVNLPTIIIMMVITILLGIWFFLDDKD